jgi:hypothetical protein
MPLEKVDRPLSAGGAHGAEEELNSRAALFSEAKSTLNGAECATSSSTGPLKLSTNDQRAAYIVGLLHPRLSSTSRRVFGTLTLIAGGAAGLATAWTRAPRMRGLLVGKNGEPLGRRTLYDAYSELEAEELAYVTLGAFSRVDPETPRINVEKVRALEPLIIERHFTSMPNPRKEPVRHAEWLADGVRIFALGTADVRIFAQRGIPSVRIFAHTTILNVDGGVAPHPDRQAPELPIGSPPEPDDALASAWRGIWLPLVAAGLCSEAAVRSTIAVRQRIHEGWALDEVLTRSREVAANALARRQTITVPDRYVAAVLRREALRDRRVPHASPGTLTGNAWADLFLRTGERRA